MRAAIYIRVSSKKQAEEGLSLPVQEKNARAYVGRQDGWTLDENHVYVERGVSGAKAQRPALDLLMAAIDAKELDVLLTTRIDRLGRNTKHNLEIFDRCLAAGMALH